MGSDELEKALGRFRKPGVDVSPLSTFHALLDQRMGHLERSVEELKTRVNGLVFLVAGAVIVQVLLRLLEWS